MRYLTLAALLLAFPVHAHDLSDLESRINGLSDTQKALTSTVGKHTSDIADLIGRIERLEAGPRKPLDMTMNEKRAADAMAHLWPLITPGPDVVACDELTWFCVAHPDDFPDLGPGYYPEIDDAKNAYVRAGSPPNGGVALAPGRHRAETMPSGLKFRTLRYRLRAVDKRRETILDCRNVSACIRTDNLRGPLFIEGIHVTGGSPVWGTRPDGSRKGPGNTAAILPKHEVTLVFMDGKASLSDNGVRTTGGDIVLYNVVLENNASRGGNHGVYASHWRQWQCEAGLFVNVRSVGNVNGHGIKSRCKNTWIQDSHLSSARGFAFDNTLGGCAVVRNTTLVKPAGVQSWYEDRFFPSRQWVVVAHALDSAVRDTGWIKRHPTNSEKDLWTQQWWRANKWRCQLTLRDVRIVNETNAGFGGIWNDIRWHDAKRDAGSDPVLINPDDGWRAEIDTSRIFRSAPVELINVTVDGEPVDESDVKGPVEIVQ